MSLDPTYVSEIFVPSIEGGKPGNLGTGYLIGYDRVLTAAHVVQGARPPDGYCQVRPLGSNKWLHAIIAYSDPEYDIAVVELLRPYEQSIKAPVWARLGSESIAVRAIGFPSFQRIGNLRDTEEFEGRTKPRSGVKSGLITAVGGDPGTNADWAGMSGAALFGEGHLVGVVLNAHVSGARLLAQPIANLMSDPLFLDALAAPSKPQLYPVGFGLAEGSQQVRAVDLVTPRAQDVLRDRFELLEPVGKGGFSVVWKAKDRKLDREVAVKILHNHFADDVSIREQFTRGARQMSRLSHSGIVTVIEPCEREGSRYYFVMEFLPGGSLGANIQNSQLAPQHVLELIIQVGDGLGYAHEHGVVHGDVKPDNILIGSDGRAKLTDFDLVKASNSTGVTLSGQAIGTFLFIAPEALGEDCEVDQRADVYSLAMTTLFALHAGDLSFDVKVAPFRYIAPLAVSEHVKAALLKALSPDPANRTESIERFCRDLAQHAWRAVDKESADASREQAWYYYAIANAHVPAFPGSAVPPTLRLHGLEQALDAIANAIALDPDNIEFNSAQRLWRAQKEIMELRGVAARTGPMLHVTTPIALEVAGDWDESEVNALMATYQKLRKIMIHEAYGILTPGLRVRLSEEQNSGDYSVLLDEVPVVRGHIASHQMLAVAYSNDIGDIESIPAPWGALIDATQAEAVRARGYSVEPRCTMIAFHILQTVERNLANFMGHQEVMNNADRLRLAASERISREPRLLTRMVLAIQGLARELVPVTAFETIVQSVLASTDKGESPDQTLRGLRLHTGIRPMLPGNTGQHRLLRLSTRAEQSIKQQMVGSGLMLADKTRTQILTACTSRAANGRYALVVQSAELRPILHAALAIEDPQPAVLTRDELLLEHESEVDPLELRLVTPDRHKAVLALDIGPSLSSRLEGDQSTHLTALAKYLNDVLHDLGLAVEIHVRLVPDEAVGLLVNGYVCPLESRHFYQDVGLQGMAWRIANSIVSWLDGIIPTSEFVRMLDERCISAELRPELTRALRRVIGCGVSCTRILNRLGDSDPVLAEFPSTKDLRVQLFVSTWTRRFLTDERVSEMLEMMQDGLFYELGVVVPQVELVADRSLANNQLRIQINDVPLPSITSLSADELLVNAPSYTIAKELNIKARPWTNPANRRQNCIVEFRDGGACEQAGYTVWDAAGCAILSLSVAIRTRAAWITPPAVVRLSTTFIEAAFPVLTDVAFAKFTSIHLAEVFARLLSEGINIRDHRGILEAMLAITGTQEVDAELGDLTVTPPNICPVPAGRSDKALTLDDYVGAARRHLRNFINHQVAPDGTMRVLELSAAIKDWARHNTGQELDLELAAHLAHALDDVVPDAHEIHVLLAPFDLRGRVGRCIARTHPFVHVLSLGEIGPGITMERIGILA